MESRDETAPSHRTWKTPVKPAFPTAPTAPAPPRKRERDEEKPNDNIHTVTLLLNCPRCPRLVSTMSRLVQGEGADRRMRGRFTRTSFARELVLSSRPGPAAQDRSCRVYAPSSACRHLLPPQKTAGGEGLSTKGRGKKRSNPVRNADYQLRTDNRQRAHQLRSALACRPRSAPSFTL